MLFTICCLRFAVYDSLSMTHCLRFAVYCVAGLHPDIKPSRAVCSSSSNFLCACRHKRIAACSFVRRSGIAACRRGTAALRLLGNLGLDLFDLLLQLFGLRFFGLLIIPAGLNLLQVGFQLGFLLLQCSGISCARGSVRSRRGR